MKHLGDITKIHGDEIEPVDVLTGGSPCQDLSVAGKQSGIKMKCENCGTFVNFKETEDLLLCPNCGSELNFTRSGLFMEQIRIIKEMRKNTNECYPKIIVWENVPGALSSNNGDDFYCVLQEFCKLMEKSFLRLDLRDGQTQGRFWENPVPSHGEFLMLNIGESPNVVVESSLSQILQDNTPAKYSLSPKACVGILRRAKHRGKDLPLRLKIALELQAGIIKENLK